MNQLARNTSFISSEAADREQQREMDRQRGGQVQTAGRWLSVELVEHPES